MYIKRDYNEKIRIAIDETGNTCIMVVELAMGNITEVRTMFQSKNEIGQFSFADARILSSRLDEHTWTLETEALIVLPGNSQNTNYTKSYADTASILFTGAVVEKAVKEGFRRYDADDRLLEEVPDKELSQQEIKKLLSELPEKYLYDVQCVEEENDRFAVLGIEYPTEDLTGADAESYQIRIRYKDVTVTWERYLNRVE